MMKTLTAAFAGLLLLGLTACGGAPDRDTYHWVDWTEAGVDGATGSATGITVTYSGDLNGNSTPDNDAEDLFTPWAETFTHDDVGAVLAGGDILRMVGGEGTGTQTLTFSPAARDPVFAIFSLGSLTDPARMVFDTDIEVLTSGRGKWGNNPTGLRVDEDGTTLLGREAYGLVRIEGTFERLSFEIPNHEADYGIQVAVRHTVE
ncbi:MAG: hypothetical protein AAF638_06035 [Pseudomonadota bacterium]